MNKETPSKTCNLVSENSFDKSRIGGFDTLTLRPFAETRP